MIQYYIGSLKMLGEDILSIVFSYNDYSDYQNFYLVNSKWRYYIRKYTNYTTLLKYMREAYFFKATKKTFFYNLCLDNKYDIANWFYRNNKNFIDKKLLSTIFRKFCIGGKIDIAEYIYSLEEIDTSAIIDMFNYICCNYDLGIAKKYYNFTNIKNIPRNYSVFLVKCNCGKLSIYQNFNSLDELDIYQSDLNDCLNGHKHMIDTFIRKNKNKSNYSITLTSANNSQYYFDFNNERKFGELILFTDINLYFIHNCQHNNILEVQNLVANTHVDISFDNCLALQLCVKKGHVELFNYLYSIGLRFCEDSKLLFYVCTYGHLDLFKSIENSRLLQLSNDLTPFFRIACYGNHYNLATYIFYKYRNRIDVSINNNEILIYCCKQGFLNMVIWLCSKDDNVKSNIYDAFRESCLNNKVSISQFLYSIKKIDLFANNNEILDICCCKNNIDVIKWIFSLKIDKEKLYQIVFNKSCKYGKIEILKFIFDIESRIFSRYIIENFDYVAMSDNLEIAEFLLNKGIVNVNKILDICYKYNSLNIIRWIHKKI